MDRVTTSGLYQWSVQPTEITYITYSDDTVIVDTTNSTLRWTRPQSGVGGNYLDLQDLQGFQDQGAGH